MMVSSWVIFVSELSGVSRTEGSTSEPRGEDRSIKGLNVCSLSPKFRLHAALIFVPSQRRNAMIRMIPMATRAQDDGVPLARFACFGGFPRRLGGGSNTAFVGVVLPPTPGMVAISDGDCLELFWSRQLLATDIVLGRLASWDCNDLHWRIGLRLSTRRLRFGKWFSAMSRTKVLMRRRSLVPSLTLFVVGGMLRTNDPEQSRVGGAQRQGPHM